MRLQQFAAVAALSASAAAQTVFENLSFGLDGHVAAGPENDVPRWSLSGIDYSPDVFSDRVVLTPPAPGNKRGAIVGQNPLYARDWKASLDFRASGQERGGGNLNIWLTKQAVDTLPSVYTVEQFDGLVIVIDQYGGSGGAIRGFLNDGSRNFRAHHNLDEMAFAQCQYAYRNLGRMSTIDLQQHGSSFEVHVNGQSCFRTDKVRMPTGYTFAITASSAENPDSFEVSKFVVSSLGGSSEQQQHDTYGSTSHHEQAGSVHHERDVYHESDTHHDEPQHHIANEAQLEFLLNTLLNKINSVHDEVRHFEHMQTDRHDELRQNWGKGGKSEGGAIPYGQLNNMELRIGAIESTVNQIKKDLEGRDYLSKLDELSRSLRDSQTNLLNSLPQSLHKVVSTSGPSMWTFVSIVAAVQIMLAGAYVVYKKRRANAPKKFL